MGAPVKAQASAAPKVAGSSTGHGGLLQRQCACGGNPGLTGECEACRKKNQGGLLQRASIPPSAFRLQPSEAPPIVHDVLRSPGQPLDAATRAFMEPRFGHHFRQVSVHRTAALATQGKLPVNQPGDIYEQEADQAANNVIHRQAPPASPVESPAAIRKHDFSHVHIHTDALAAAAAKAINARAFTVGQEIVFGAGEYAPTSAAGRRLLAHELAHVVQQGSDRGAGLVQRAEVDDRSCAGLTDIETDIDTLVNGEIAAARTAAGSPIAVPAFLKDVMTRLGKGAVSPIEKFIEGLPASKRNLPPSNLAGTKYSGVGAVNRFYHLQTLGLAHVVGSAAKVAGICIGADKLGHFFQEGFIYFQIAPAPGGATADAQSAGRALEIGIQGLGVGAAVGTGVYSNADQAANLAGMQFYKDLQAAPSTFTFNIKNYITARWNEQSNPSFYESSVGSIVWSNLLTGAWQGPFTSGGGKPPAIDSKIDLRVTGSSVTGTYEWPAAKPTNKGKIKSGVITQRTTGVSGALPGRPSLSATPVSGISIEFDWEEGKASGKGKWDSVDEQTLDGTWGIGASQTDGGTWKLKKV